MKTFITNISPGGLACLGSFAGDDSNPSNNNAEYSCIDPPAGNDLLDYFNGALNTDRVKAFEEHLFLCHKCQDAFLQLDAVFDVLKEQILGGSGGYHDAHKASGKQRKPANIMSKTCSSGLDERCRDDNGEIRRKNGNTLVGTLRETYGEDFAAGRRADLKLENLLEQTGSSSLSDYLRNQKK